MTVLELRSIVYGYYSLNKRLMPWRDIDDAYKIFVSEVMLQQTQVPRVMQKYESFVERFPTVSALAEGSMLDLLRYWQGLGYNRRALWLQQSAKVIMLEYAGLMPSKIEELMKLPGVGKNTAAAMLVYAYNQPHVFIETNIRTVFIHHFFPTTNQIADQMLLPMIQEALDWEQPRDWYYALMDYGSYLKGQHKNPSQRSRGHRKQSQFTGSTRQLRGQLLRELTASDGSIELGALMTRYDQRVEKIVNELEQEGFIVREQSLIRLR